MKRLLCLFLLALSSQVFAGNNYNTLDSGLFPTTYGTANYCWTSNGAGLAPTWQACAAGGGGSGTVTSASVITGNGFGGTVANATTTPAITLTTSVVGLMLGNGTAASAYAGTTCTNQFTRSLNASGVATCASVANADLAGSIAASKLVGTDIATVGTLTGGTWNATTIGTLYGGTGVTDLTFSGSTHKAATTTGTLTSGNCVKIDASGNLVDHGSACGGGTVTITGTPSSGQATEWTSATAIQGVAVTGTGSYVKSASPTLTGTLTGAAANFSGNVTAANLTALSGTLTNGGAMYSDGTNVLSGTALTNHAIVLGTGASGTGPKPLASVGTTTTLLHGSASGDPTFGSVVTADIAANAVTSAQLAVVNTRRVCDIAIGDTSGSAITNAQLGPQKRICYIPAAATIQEINVAADAGTPNVIVGKNAAGVVTNLLSSALATAASGGIACSNTGGTTGIDGATTCSATLQNNTSIAAGTYLELVSGTAGATAKFMTVHIVYTVN